MTTSPATHPAITDQVSLATSSDKHTLLPSDPSCITDQLSQQLQQQPSATSSSLLQTIFNTSNLIMGISLLGLPFAFKLSGWLCGILFIIIFGLTAASTAKILARCQRHHLITTGQPLLTYGDIGEAAFGYRGRWFIQIIFTMELFAATVAMLLLVFHTVYDLMQPLGVDQDLVRIVIWCLLTTLTWPKSLSVLSYGSLLGVLCLVNLVVAVLFDGTYKQRAPGSLWEPMPTSLWPECPFALARSMGLFMAGFAGHACFPGFYASMARPRRFPVAMNTSFILAVVLYLVVGAAGYLMFGQTLSDGLIIRYLDSIDYPRAVYLTTCILLAANPATKYPLTIYPIVLDAERFIFNRFLLGSSFSQLRNRPSCSLANFLRRETTQRIFLRTFVSALVLGCAYWIHQFELVIGLLGSLFATTTSIIFPLLCYLAMALPPPSSSSPLPDANSHQDVEDLLNRDIISSSSASRRSKLNGADRSDNEEDNCDDEVAIEKRPLLGTTKHLTGRRRHKKSDLIMLNAYEKSLIWITIALFASIGIIGTVVSILPQQ